VLTGENDTGEKASVGENILLLFGHLKKGDFWKRINADGPKAKVKWHTSKEGPNNRGLTQFL